MAGKKFAAEFALRRNVSALDKILIQDSDDDVVKYAYPPQIAALSGYAYAKSIADLPLMPSNKSIGYIVGQMLYIYVGMGGDTKDGLYQSVGFFVGPQGVQGEKGEQGEQGEQGIQGPKGDNGGLSLQELDEYLATKQYVTGDTLAEMLAGYVSNTSLMRDYVTIAKTQDVTGVKNFTAGLQFGGVPMYKSKGDTVFLDGNLVVRGGITAFGTNETITPSIFEALPIDGTTIGRNEKGELYVIGGTSGGGSGTGGGISIADVENYLTGNGYITSDALEPYALKTAIPTNTNQLTNGAGFITGISSSMVTNALGYTPLSTSGGTITGEVTISCAANTPLKINSNATDSGVYFNHNGISKTWVGFEASRGSVLYHSDGSHRLGINNNGVAFYDSNTLLHSGNYSDYALPKDGTAVAANRLIEEVVTDLNNATAGRIFTMTSGYGSTAGNKPTEYWVTGLTLSYAQNSSFRRQLAFADAIDESLYLRAEHIGVWGEWSKVLTSSNFYDYALPITGGTISGDLDIGGSVYSSVGNLRIKARNSTMAGVEIAVSDTDYWQISHRGIYANNELHFYHNANGTWSNSVLSLISDGSVIVGNNLLAKGGVTATNSSDRRLKRNLRKFNASKVLMSLGGVWEYEYIDSEVQKNHIYEGTHYGLIYQNVKGTTLDVMCHEREDGFGTLNYIHPKFISLIAGATMENISEVEKLKRKIRHLEAKVKQLEQKA